MVPYRSVWEKLQEPKSVIYEEAVTLDVLQKYYAFPKEFRGAAAQKSPTGGIGIFARRDIFKGQRIVQYVREVLTEWKANYRERWYCEEGKREYIPLLDTQFRAVD